jgi:hypothetical protein
MTTKNKAPIEKIRDGSLEISIWANETEKGIRYAADGVIRNYRVGEEWSKTRSLSNGELLRAARLNELAYSRILELRQSDKATAT